MDTGLRAGVARVDITPPVGINMVGYYIREGAPTGVEPPESNEIIALGSKRESRPKRRPAML